MSQIQVQPMDDKVQIELISRLKQHEESQHHLQVKLQLEEANRALLEAEGKFIKAQNYADLLRGILMKYKEKSPYNNPVDGEADHMHFFHYVCNSINRALIELTPKDCVWITTTNTSNQKIMKRVKLVSIKWNCKGDGGFASYKSLDDEKDEEKHISWNGFYIENLNFAVILPVRFDGICEEECQTLYSLFWELKVLRKQPNYTANLIFESKSHVKA